MGDTAPARSAVVEGLLLAISHSRLRPLGRDDALRDILFVDYPDLTADGVLDLEVFWSLLAEHPDFDAEGAVAPMCVIKSWEQRLGMDVRLPENLQALTEKDIALKVTECAVPKAEVARALRTAEERAHRASLVRDAVADAGSTQGPQHRSSWRDHSAVGIGAGVAFVGAMVFLLISSLQECHTGEWTQINAADVSAGIPVASASELGTQVSVELSDDAWAKKAPDERRDQMETALRSLESRGTESLIVRDSRGEIRATAQWYANHSKIKVGFR